MDTVYLRHLRVSFRALVTSTRCSVCDSGLCMAHTLHVSTIIDDAYETRRRLLVYNALNTTVEIPRPATLITTTTTAC